MGGFLVWENIKTSSWPDVQFLHPQQGLSHLPDNLLFRWICRSFRLGKQGLPIFVVLYSPVPGITSFIAFRTKDVFNSYVAAEYCPLGSKSVLMLLIDTLATRRLNWAVIPSLSPALNVKVALPFLSFIFPLIGRQSLVCASANAMVFFKKSSLFSTPVK